MLRSHHHHLRAFVKLSLVGCLLREWIYKWVTFTYNGKETNFITNLFRKTNLKIAFRTNNTFKSLLRHKQQVPDIYTQSRVYKLMCPDCKKAYVGQTGRGFQVRFNEHKNAFKTVTLQTLHNTSMNRHTHSTPSITQCKYYSGKTKGSTSTQYYVFTFMQNT